MKKTLNIVSVAILTCAMSITPMSYPKLKTVKNNPIISVDLTEKIYAYAKENPINQTRVTSNAAITVKPKPKKAKIKKVKACIRYVIADNLNIRTNASKNSKSVGYFTYGNKIKVRYKTNNKWGKIKYKGKTRYIHINYLSKKKPKTSIKDYNSYIDYTPPHHNGFYSYEPSSLITRSNSLAEGKLHQKYVTDTETGIETVNGRYCIALGSYYTTKIGTPVDLIMNNGKTVKCIIADSKNDKDTDSNNQLHKSDGSLVEVVVNYPYLKEIMYRKNGINTGNVADVLYSLKGKVKTIRIYKKRK